MATPLQGTPSAANAIARVKYSHDALIDAMLVNPAASQGELAAQFGYTQAWLSRVMNSDAFQARLAERRTELVDPTIVATIDEKLRAAASASLDVVLEKVILTRDAGLALKTAEMATKALGYGARQQAQGPVVQNNFVVALPPKAVSAEDWAAQHAPGGRVVEGGRADLQDPPAAAQEKPL